MSTQKRGGSGGGELNEQDQLTSVKTMLEKSEPTSSMDEVCRQLDELLMRKLELIQDYCNLSQQSEAYQKDGYLNLAKSRYIQGSSSISQIRLPTEDSEEYPAVLTVASEDSNEDTSPIKSKKRSVLQEVEQSAETKLLRQFGVLSSSSVKTAQKDFRKTVELCIERINVAEELTLVQKRFNLLHGVKNELRLNH